MKCEHDLVYLEYNDEVLCRKCGDTWKIDKSKNAWEWSWVYRPSSTSQSYPYEHDFVVLYV